RLLSLLHSKGLSNPFIISENKELKLSFSSNGEYIFLPSLQGNEEDDSNGQTHDNHYEDEDPVVFNFAVILSLEKDTEIDIKAGFLSSIADITWSKGIPNNRSVKNETFEVGHLDLSLSSYSMNYHVSGSADRVVELDTAIVSRSYKLKKIGDISGEPYFDAHDEFKFYNRHSANGKKLLSAGDHVFFNSVLISPSVTESLNTLNTHISHNFKMFINDHCYRHELNVVRGPPLAGISSNDKPLYINKTWNDALAYEITMPKKFVTIGDELPLKMKFSPLQKNVILKRIKINVLETLTYCSKDLKYETDDTESAIQEKYITGTNTTEDSYKVAPLLEIKSSLTRNSQALREVILKQSHLLNSDNILESCYELDSHHRQTAAVQITGPLRILSYLSFQNKENISKLTDKETKMVNERYNLDITTRYNDFKHRLHPDSSNSKFVKISHKFQISLRVSKLNPDENRYHHYEVIIDTPIYLLDSNCTGSNLLLPSYNDSTGSTHTNNTALNNLLEDFEINFPSSEPNQLPTFEEATSPLNSPALIPVAFASTESNTNVLSRTSTIGTATLERYRSNIDDLLAPSATGINASGAEMSRRGSRVSSSEPDLLEEEPVNAEAPPEYSESLALLATEESDQSLNTSESSLSSAVCKSNNTSLSSPNTSGGGDTTAAAGVGTLDRESMDLTEQFHKAVYDGISRISQVNMESPHAIIAYEPTPTPTDSTSLINTQSLSSLYTQLLNQTHRIFAHQELTVSQLRLYKTVQWICCNSRSFSKSAGLSKFNVSSLTTVVYQLVDQHLDELFHQRSDSFRLDDPESCLAAFVEVYEDMNNISLKLQRVYAYLDRSYLLNNSSKKSISSYWRTQCYLKIHSYEGLNTAIIMGFVGMLNRLRKGEVSTDNVPLVETLVKINQIFEPTSSRDVESLTIEQSLIFYKDLHRAIMSENINSNTPELIFTQMEKFILKEFQLWNDPKLAQSYLSTHLKSESLRSVLFDNYESDLPIYVTALFEKKRFNDLHTLYQQIHQQEHLSHSKDLSTIFTNCWSSYISKYLLQITETLTDLSLITQILDTKRHFSKLLAKYFFNPATKEGTDQLDYELRKTFLETLSIQAVSVLVKKNLIIYVDKFFKTLNTDDLGQGKQTLSDIADLFNSCVTNKEEFLVDYKRIMTKRLVMDKSKSLYLERELAKLLEKSAGVVVTTDIFKVIDDIEKSKAMSAEYSTSHSSSVDSLRFEQLTLAGPQDPKLDLLETLKDSNEELRSLYDYRERYAGFLCQADSFKNKVFKYDTSKGRISLSFPHFSSSASAPSASPQFLLTMAENMALVLLLFNSYESLTRKMIETLTKLPEEEVYSILQSLSAGRYKILLKDQQSNYMINDNFESGFKKSNTVRELNIKYIEFSSSSFSSSSSAESNQNKTIDSADLEGPMQAFVIRLLKNQYQNHSITHSKLVSCILEKFANVTNEFIKRVIGGLIDREFIKRVNGEGYVYLP
ncbi:hypothetical protein WICPIJ_008146, partial [Wickerhamomyces pijperi]